MRLGRRPRRVPRPASRGPRRPRFEFSTLADFLAHPYPQGRAAARRARHDLPRRRLAADGLRRRRLRQEHLDDRRDRPPRRRRDWLGVPVPRPVAFLRHRERRPAVPVPARSSRQDRELGRRPTSRTTSSSSRGPGASSRSPNPEARAALIAVLRRARRSTSSPPTPRSGSASPPPAAPTRHSSSSTGSSSAASKPTAPSGSSTTRTRPARSRATGAATPTPRCSSSRTATGRAPSSTGRRPAGRRCQPRRSPEVVHARVGRRDAGLQRRRARHRRRLRRRAPRPASTSTWREHPWSPDQGHRRRGQGRRERIRKLLDGDRFDCVEGRRGAISGTSPLTVPTDGTVRNSEPQTRIATGFDRSVTVLSSVRFPSNG